MATLTTDSERPALPAGSGKPLLDQRLTVDVSDYWFILCRRKVQVFTVFTILLTLICVYGRSRTPVYHSTCEIRIASRQPMAVIQGPKIHFFGDSSNALDTELKLISSDVTMLQLALDNIRAEISTKNLSLKPETMQYIKSMDRIQLAGHINAERQKGNTQLASITASGTDPVFTQIVAQVVADTYKDSFSEHKTQQALDTKTFIEKLQSDNAAAMQDVKDKIAATVTKVTRFGDTGQLKKDLARMQIQLDEYLLLYTDLHPKVKIIKQRIAAIDTRLQAHPEPQLHLDSLKAELVLMNTHAAALFQQVMTAQIDYKRKFEVAESEIRVTNPATLGRKQSANTRMNLIIGMVFSLLLASISAFVWEGMDTSIGKIEEVERLTNLPVIAHIPIVGKLNDTPFYKFWVKDDKRKSTLARVLYNFDQKSVAAEAYRALRTNVEFATRHLRDHKIIAISSSSPREGKTLTAANLAIAIAHMGRSVLVIGADMRRTELSALFRLDAKPGLSDLLVGSVTEDEAIRTVTDLLVSGTEWDKIMNFQGIDNLNIITGGEPPPNPAELVGSASFKQLLDSFRERYDYIILDTPPVLPVTDASIIASNVDATILIYQSNKTSRHLLLRAMHTLEKNHANVIGIVINQLSYDVTMHQSRASGYSGYGYY
jgi:capsular exopolysaccharide synthesis family protein